MPLPKSRGEILAIQSQRKRVAVEQAMRSPFWRKRLPKSISLDRLDEPEVWRSIPILDKDTLRAMTDAQFYGEFCLQEHDGIAEYWRPVGQVFSRCAASRGITVNWAGSGTSTS